MSGDVGGTTSGDDRMTDATFAALLDEAEQACSLMDDSVVRRMRSGDRAQGMAPFEVLRVMLSRLVEAVRASGVFAAHTRTMEALVADPAARARQDTALPEGLDEVVEWIVALADPGNWPGVAYDAATTRSVARRRIAAALAPGNNDRARLDWHERARRVQADQGGAFLLHNSGATRERLAFFTPCPTFRAACDEGMWQEAHPDEVSENARAMIEAASAHAGEAGHG